MVEEIVELGKRTSKGISHYSEKGGHRLRGFYWKTQARLECVFPSTNMRYIPGYEHTKAESTWLIRRNMFRDPRDGKR